MLSKLLIATAAAAAVALAAGTASAEYPEKDITWIIPYSPGGGMDSTSRALASVLPGIDWGQGSPISHVYVPDGRYLAAKWRGVKLPVAGGGLIADEWVEKAGLDPDKCGAGCMSFFLEGCAQVRYDIEDARSLWRPPYVP